MKLPRDISGQAIVSGLRRVGYEDTRQKGDHVYMTTTRNGEHHGAIPLQIKKVGTLGSILGAVAGHLGISREELLRAVKI